MQSVVQVQKLFHANPALVWKYLSDTATMNRHLKLKPMHFETINGIRHGSQKVVFLNTKWTESPWEWVREKWLTNKRDYSKGFILSVTSRFEITEINSKSQVTLSFKIDHRYPIVAHLIDKKTYSVAQRMISYIEKCIEAEKTKSINTYSKSFEQWISSAHDVQRARIEPKKLSLELNSNWQQIITQALSTSWNSRFSLLFDAVCPHCQGSVATAPRLTDLPSKIDCSSCDINFDLSKKEHLSMTIRDGLVPIDQNGVDFCSSDVSHKPLVVFQMINNNWQLTLDLKPGLYTLKRRGIVQGQLISVSRDSLTQDYCFADHWSNAGDSTLSLNNKVDFNSKGLSENEVCFLEFLSHETANLSVAEAMLDIDIAKLIPSDCLTSDFPIEMGTKTLLFTDVVGSTDLYYEVGDALAFKKIRQSFLHIGQVCSRYNAILVKTIGDAAMYAFATPLEAVSAAIAIQRENPTENLPLRITLHTGKCISISTKDGQDFFGDTVNICAKFQSEANGHEVVFDQSILNNQIIDLIETVDKEDITFAIRGKNHRDFNLVRLKVC